MRARKKGRFFLPEELVNKITNLKEYEKDYRLKCKFTSNIDIVGRIFFEKDEYEWIKNMESGGWFVSSKYHRYYNLNSQKGIKAFNKLNFNEQEFYFERCRKTIKKVYNSKNSYSFLHFYESLENTYVKKEKEKAVEYFNKYIKPEIQSEINKLKEYERKISNDLKKFYRINYFPSIVNAHFFEINQSKTEVKYNLHTKTGINRFRKLSKDDKFKFLEVLKAKIHNFHISNKDYYSSSGLNKKPMIKNFN